MLTGIVVVSYRNAEGTARYVARQLSRLVDDYRLAVVDVDADAEHGQRLAESCGLVMVDGISNTVGDNSRGWLVAVRDNIGYARGNNLGVQMLRATGLPFDNYLFSNDDIEILSPDILGVLAARMLDDESLVGVGPRMIGIDGADQNPHFSYISPWRQMGWRLFAALRRKRNSQDSVQTPCDCYWVSGAFMMVKARCFDAVDGFDPRTFLYFEEAILAERFKRQGWRFAYEPCVCVRHYEGGSTHVRRKERDAIEMRSRLIYYKEYMHEHSFVLWLYRTICR